MSYLFKPFPKIRYDIKKNGKLETMTNVSLRFKLRDAFKNNSIVTYDYQVVDGERADIIAHKYYKDSTLDWIIYLANDIINPLWEWPLDNQSFRAYVIEKYGSIGEATSEVRHYEIITRAASVTFDGTLIPEQRIIVDKQTYDLHDPLNREAVSNYVYELRLNEAKANIKIIDVNYIDKIINELDTIFE